MHVKLICKIMLYVGGLNPKEIDLLGDLGMDFDIMLITPTVGNLTS